MESNLKAIPISRKISRFLLFAAVFNTLLLLTLYLRTNNQGLFSYAKSHEVWVPSFTLFVISLHGVSYVLGILIITLLVKEKLIRKKSISTTINLTVIILSFLCLLIYIFALFLPFVVQS